IDPAVTGAIQYAYDYAVVEPSCVTSPAPAYIGLHGWAGNTYGPVTSDPDAYYWCCYKIYPTDVSETWFYGFARDCDYRTGAEPAGGDVIENYTERRILRMLYDLVRQPPGPSVDTNRIYVFGGSMGGSGTLAFALRYPDLFAAAYASQPMTDYSTSGDAGGTPWRNDVWWKWGAVASNLPVRSDAPGGWADHLKSFDGTGVWTWQNHRRTASNLVARASVPLGFGHGTNDFVIEWPTQGGPAYPAFNAGRRCWGGTVTGGGHSWMGWAGSPPTIAPDGSLTPFRGLSVRRNESVPGLSNAEGDSPLPPAGPGGYNQEIDWSASWYNWDGPPTDSSNVWQVSLRSLNGATQAVDVTARRLQRFPVAPGSRVLWRNLFIGSGQTSQVGVVAADGEGLITVPGVLVAPGGNRLRLDADGGPDSDDDGMPDYWEDAFGLGASDPDDAGLDADGDRSPNLDEYRAGTLPRDATSLFRITYYDEGGMGWYGTPGFRYVLETTPALATPFSAYLSVTAATHQAEVPAPFGDVPARFWRVGTGL
ncbi:MAG: prolyl oligopeptidase family serine peptidase, partial [Verrucomicrobia bacterium]|nr:prolyl oligopeptidase family serine peptidase [Verrucomicrobiota bacterium]